jgi:hypothetical protein
MPGPPSAGTADEGVAVVIELSALDADFDHVQWSVSGLPQGMTVVPVRLELGLHHAGR